jgi:tetratricopeptide (TPR) repeat protein
MRSLLTLVLCTSAFAQEPPTIKSDTEHDYAYQKATALISPYMRLSDSAPPITDAARKDLRQGVLYMRAVTRYNPHNWAAFWIEGKAFQALDEAQAAHEAFQSAYTLQTRNADVAREYAQSCLALGRNADAIAATQHAIELEPDDAGLHANLALAYLIAGRNHDALLTIGKSLRLDPADVVSLRLKTVIEDVLARKRLQPRRLAELER